MSVCVRETLDWHTIKSIKDYLHLVSFTAKKKYECVKVHTQRIYIYEDERFSIRVIDYIGT